MILPIESKIILYMFPIMVTNDRVFLISYAE